MSATQDTDMFNSLLYPECLCRKRAPYILIARLDRNGDPVWKPDSAASLISILDIRRVAICETLDCNFLLDWAEGHATQRGVNRNAQRSQFDQVGIAGDGNNIGDYFVNMNFGLLQENSIPISMLHHPSFRTLVDNSTRLPEQRRWELISWLIFLFGMR
ncbi:hypothetical protein F5Y12DRAFT_176239 [Xylaria sp. FL1777]|nr:hypothetical protein F5Y12DRAFT_176239 [Xylaria sp. FL1777]